jgi:hypothetical protein
MLKVTLRRIAALEGRIAPKRERAQIVMCSIEDWPGAGQAAWEDAVQAGDRRWQEDLVEQYEGVRPDLHGPWVGLILVPPRVGDGV